MVPYTCNPSTQKGEAGRTQVEGQPGLYTGNSKLTWAAQQSLAKNKNFRR